MSKRQPTTSKSVRSGVSSQARTAFDGNLADVFVEAENGTAVSCNFPYVAGNHTLRSHSYKCRSYTEHREENLQYHQIYNEWNTHQSTVSTSYLRTEPAKQHITDLNIRNHRIRQIQKCPATYVTDFTQRSKFRLLTGGNTSSNCFDSFYFSEACRIGRSAE